MRRSFQAYIKIVTIVEEVNRITFGNAHAAEMKKPLGSG
jgi:hypothetical protein